MRVRLILAGVATVLIAAPIASVAAGPEVPFPLGYRTWTHIKSGWTGEANPGGLGRAGMHHIYANPEAMTGYRTGTFPVGSVLVFDLLATKGGADSLATSDRRLRDVMEKTAQGWRFTEFKADSHTERLITTEAAVKACAACHEGAKRDHVFSTFTEAEDR
jgi:hypothetical protein